jgi:hypothetical protein
MGNIFNPQECGHCQSYLESPAVLQPCGVSICQMHLIENQEGSFLCKKCGIEHKITDENDVLNKNLPEPKFDAVKNLEEKNEAKKSCENFDDLLTKIELLLQDPYNFTYELIKNLKNEVQLKGEEAILKINENMTRAISKLDEYNIEFRNGLKEPEYLVRSEKFKVENETSRSDLENWMATLDVIETKNDDENEWKRIKSESEKAFEDFKIKFVEFKIDLFSTGFLEFQYEIEKDFGEFEFGPNFELG